MNQLSLVTCTIILLFVLCCVIYIRKKCEGAYYLVVIIYYCDRDDQHWKINRRLSNVTAIQLVSPKDS